MPDRCESRNRALILVVDDCSSTRVMARDVLEQAGLDVAEAGDVGEALRCFGERGPDLVLLDTELSGSNGLEVCSSIRRHPERRHTPVMIMTARDDLPSIHRAYEAGATDFVTKPMNWLILTHRIRYMLRANELLMRLATSEERLAEAQRIAKLGHWEWDLSRGTLDGSIEFRRIFGFASHERPLTWDLLLRHVHQDDRELLETAVTRATSGDSKIRIDLRIVSPQSAERFVHMNGTRTRGDPVRALGGIVQDITERKQAEEEIRFLAYHDSLTRLGNRHLFKEHLSRALAYTRRHGGIVTVLFLDLDHFKRINDMLGHSTGDLLLRRIADRLAKCLRETDMVSRMVSDETNTSVSRFGGDEFIILLSEVADSKAAAGVAKRVLDVLRAPLIVHDQDVVIGGSIGIAVAPRDGDDTDTLLRHADAAMYHAKQLGGNNFQFFQESLRASSSKSLWMESELRHALERGELQVYYQPKVDILSSQITGFEALLRWPHPTLGMVLPGDFLPMAEQLGLIGAIGKFVLRTACQQAKAWQAVGLETFRVSVNLSPQQFKDGRIVETVTDTLSETGLNPHLLELEITENTLIENEAVAIEALRSIKGIGIAVSLDDFGTGYSSLSYLKRFPVDTVKIDRSFVRDIATDPEDAAIAAAIISIAQTLNLRVVAEGVETEEQRAFLAERGCDEMQGYLFGPAVPAEAITELLEKQ